MPNAPENADKDKAVAELLDSTSASIVLAIFADGAVVCCHQPDIPDLTLMDAVYNATSMLRKQLGRGR